MQTFRRPSGQRIAIALVAALLIGTSALLCSVAAYLLWQSPGWGLLMAAIAAFNVALTSAMVREALGQWRTLIGVDPRGVALRLPARRGHASLTRVDQRVAFDSIGSIDTRCEYFSTVGMTMGQQAWAIRLRDGSRIELGADRDRQAAFFGPAAEAIAAAASVPIRDLGAVDGRPGVLVVWASSVPDWDTPSLAPDVIGVRSQSTSLAWRIAAAAVSLVLLARLLAELL